MVYLVFFLCVLNVVLWIFFLRNFKKLFTTDDIIGSAKSECNKIVIDLNRNADRNITVLNDRINSLQGLIKEADRKIKILMEFEKKEAGLSELHSKISGAHASRRTDAAVKKAADAYGKKSAASERLSLTESARTELNDDFQKTLFDDVPHVRTEAVVTVREDGASYAEIPVVTPDVFVAEKPSGFSKNDLKAKIISLFDSGSSIEDIALRLSCSMTEVQFALTLENRI